MSPQIYSYVALWIYNLMHKCPLIVQVPCLSEFFFGKHYNLHYVWTYPDIVQQHTISRMRISSPTPPLTAPAIIFSVCDNPVIATKKKIRIIFFQNWNSINRIIFCHHSYILKFNRSNFGNHIIFFYCVPLETKIATN